MAASNKTTITVEPGRQEVFIQREYDAPREPVFTAFTDPALFVQWVGPREYTTRLETHAAASGVRDSYDRLDEIFETMTTGR